MTVFAATFSWYFLVGPLVLDPGVSRFTALVASSYPVLDLVLLSCLIILWIRSDESRFRHALTILTAAIVTFVLGDSIFQYQQIAGPYRTGTLLDATWVASGMLIALAAIVLVVELGRSTIPDAVTGQSTIRGPGTTFASRIEYVPYLALPVMLGFFMSLRNTPG